MQKQMSQLGSIGGSGVGVGYEGELGSLRQELAKKDEMIQQLSSQQEGMAKNMTAMMTYSAQSSASIKSLSEKCEKLEVRFGGTSSTSSTSLNLPPPPPPPPPPKLLNLWHIIHWWVQGGGGGVIGRD